MSLKVLVVDDEPDVELLIRQRFRKQIRAEEVAFAFAHDGVDALRVLEEDEEIDVVLSDINMPRMDGLTLLQRIAALNRLLKVVIVSAYGDMENIRTAMNRGAFDFVTKPIDFADLDLTLEKTRKELHALKKALVSTRELDVIKRDLDIARNIQLSFVPKATSASHGNVHVHAVMHPAKEVGGDFYDFVPLGDNRFGFAIGDVAGKGLGAAIFMAVTRTLLRSTALTCPDPDECLARVNQVLYAEAPPNLFVTAIYGVLDGDSGTLHYANAGHNPPLFVSSSGEARLMRDARGPALCLLEKAMFRTNVVQLSENDTMLLYTDGVPEAAAADGERFEDHRLIDAARAAADTDPVSLVQDVIREVTQFSGPSQYDDMTILALGFRAADMEVGDTYSSGESGRQAG